MEDVYSHSFCVQMTLRYSIKLLHFNLLPDEQEAVNQDKDVDYNLDVNEAESETDKQAALAGIENGKKEKTKYHMLKMLRSYFAWHPVASYT